MHTRANMGTRGQDWQIMEQEEKENHGGGGWFWAKVKKIKEAKPDIFDT